MRNWIRVVVLLAIACSTASVGQTMPAKVPSLVKFSGVLSEVNGGVPMSLVGVTFSFYADQQGGSPLWTETQNVQADKSGHYSVTLGSTTSQGLPTSLFTSGEARWVGVQVQGQPEQPRVLLVSVPYALKAVDAQTIGGLPPTAFVLAAPPNPAVSHGSSSGSNVNGISQAVSGSGTADYVPLWTDNNGTLGNSAIFQGGTAKKPKIGIGTTKPASTLDVKGGGTIRGALSLPATGTATATAGANSQPLDLAASAFNSGAGTALAQTFQWQTEPVGNNSSNPSGSLNLLFGSGSNVPSETGFNIASNGLITFASGQTFPGTGNGTITGVTAGTDLTGGGTSGNVTLDLDTTKVPQLVSNNTFTGTAQFPTLGIGAVPNTNGWTPLALGGANSFGTWVTLANTSSGGHTWNILSAGSGNSEGAGNLGITDFTGTSTINLEGNTNTASLTANGIVSGAVVNAATSFNLAGQTFAFGSGINGNVFLGFSGNSTTTGVGNTTSGVSALLHNTSGNSNSAHGFLALFSNTTGYNNTAHGAYTLVDNTTGYGNTATGNAVLYSNTTGFDNTADGDSALLDNTVGTANTAVGRGALYYNTTGSLNTAVGFAAGSDVNSPNLNNATAIGAYADVTESNALVLGSINGVNGANANTFVGIGTTAPSQSLEVDSGNSLVRGTNNFQKDGDTANLFMGDINNFIQSIHGSGITIGVYQVPNAVHIAQYNGAVGIGTASPDNLLTVNGSADKPGGGSWGTYSDGRLKTLHGTFTSGLSQIMRLHPIRYRYKADNAMGIRDRDEHIGFVAQDVRRVIPEAVTENDKGYLLVNNDPILWTMLNAIKEQQREIRVLRSQLRNRSTRRTETAASASTDARDRQLRRLTSELKALREKDSSMEVRLARLERALNSSGNQTTAVAMAAAETGIQK